MSYLGFPRLVFSGRFQADPSTVNNDPHHFDSADFRSNYQIPGPGASNGWWNPGGSAAWRFFDCKVETVIYRDGSVCDDPTLDSVVGMPVTSAGARAEGKLVDLDPEQQMVSEIWGFQVFVGSSSTRVAVGGDFEPSPFTDIWARFPTGQPDSFFGAYYQSVLRHLVWNEQEDSHGPAGPSRFLRELGRPRELSIKFNVDGYDDTSGSDWFTFGRVVGSIGLRDPGDPVRVVPGRRMNPAAANFGIGMALEHESENGHTLSLDLGNSLPTQSVGGPLQELGHLQLAVETDPGSRNVPATYVTLAEIDYQCADWYTSRAGIVDLPLDDEQRALIADKPLVVRQVQPSIGQIVPVLAEPSNGQWVRADGFVFRIDSGESASTTLYARQYGRPLAHTEISLGFDNTQVEGQVKQGNISGPPAARPLDALHFPTSGTTDAEGKLEITLEGDLGRAGDPNPRSYIDGQVYGVAYGVGSEAPPPGAAATPSDLLNPLVWSPYRVPAKPTWMDDVSPIFTQYANLYPVMRPIVDLANYASVRERLSIMRRVFHLEPSDPNYMPVTRDLSTPKRRMIREWLKRPRYMRFDSREDLLKALQQAVELEHATLPPYLTALYSIKRGQNVEISELIRSVAIEEMLHMSLAANLLVSVGGHPSIDSPAFVPRYPGPLPGGLRANLIVRLRRCSIQQIRNVFLSIEQPEEQFEAVDGEVDRDNPEERSQFTIGWFYDQIERSLRRLHRQGEIRFGHADRQVRARVGEHEVFRIESLEDALRAIDEIQEQGEGSSALDPAEGPDTDELSHYYKFSEIVHGRRIVIDHENQSFAYDGEEVPFDPDGVWPVVDDPELAIYAEGTRPRILARQFAESYQALLKALHRVWNGHPGELTSAIGLMYSLEVQAQTLVRTPSGLDDGTTVGPVFQLPYPA